MLVIVLCVCTQTRMRPLTLRSASGSHSQLAAAPTAASTAAQHGTNAMPNMVMLCYAALDARAVNNSLLLCLSLSLSTSLSLSSPRPLLALFNYHNSLSFKLTIFHSISIKAGDRYIDKYVHKCTLSHAHILHIHLYVCRSHSCTFHSLNLVWQRCSVSPLPIPFYFCLTYFVLHLAQHKKWKPFSVCECLKKGIKHERNI